MRRSSGRGRGGKGKSAVVADEREDEGRDRDSMQRGRIFVAAGSENGGSREA